MQFSPLGTQASPGWGCKHGGRHDKGGSMQVEGRLQCSPVQMEDKIHVHLEFSNSYLAKVKQVKLISIMHFT